MTDLFENPMGLDGFEFVEFTAPEKGFLEPIFEMTFWKTLPISRPPTFRKKIRLRVCQFSEPKREPGKCHLITKTPGESSDS